MSNFGKEMRKIMIDKNIKLKDLAQAVGISTPYISDILNGNRSGKRYITKIAEYLESEQLKEQ